jgi:hypothetical protein
MKIEKPTNIQWIKVVNPIELGLNIGIGLLIIGLILSIFGFLIKTIFL